MAGLYDYRWQKARLRFLRVNPLCVMCAKRGITRLATVVDHVIPHKGDEQLFWDETNWQALCATHHNADKQRLEKSGKVIGCDEHGFPFDPAHHWQKP